MKKFWLGVRRELRYLFCPSADDIAEDQHRKWYVTDPLEFWKYHKVGFKSDMNRWENWK